jgi:hypothetical protein
VAGSASASATPGPPTNTTITDGSREAPHNPGRLTRPWPCSLVGWCLDHDDDKAHFIGGDLTDTDQAVEQTNSWLDHVADSPTDPAHLGFTALPPAKPR